MTATSTGATSTLHYVHNDWLSGLNVTTNASGTVEEVTDYYPYGAVHMDTKPANFNETRKYIGQVYDGATGLNYLNARYQDGARGQFISEDPTFWSQNQNLSDPQSLNSYSYANDNPINKSDPNGLAASDPSSQAVQAAIQGKINDIKSQVQALWTTLTVNTPKAALSGAWNPIAGYNTAMDSSNPGIVRAAAGAGAIAGGLSIGKDAAALGLRGATIAGTKLLTTGGAEIALPAETLVCRGGGCGAADFLAGTGVKQMSNGTLSGVSVLVGVNGESKAALLNQLPARFGGQGSFTTLGQLQSTPATLLQTGNNLSHFEMGGLTPQGFANVFK